MVDNPDKTDSSTPKLNKSEQKSLLSQRFRGYFPVVIDVETAGFNAQTDALLELAASVLTIDEITGLIAIDETIQFNIDPFEGANLEPAGSKLAPSKGSILN